MKPLITVAGIAASLPQDDVDTDQVLPTPWLRDPNANLAEGLFGYLRRPQADGKQNEFILAQERYKLTRILVCGKNFGCGSSREHAVWAVKAFGIGCLIATSFADVFQENCLRNGILAVTLPPDQMEILHARVQAVAGAEPFLVNLENQSITDPDGTVTPFSIAASEREALMLGLDDIGLSERHLDEIEDWERKAIGSLPVLQDFRILPETPLNK